MYKITPKDKDVERPRITYMERIERGIMKEGKLHKESKKERNTHRAFVVYLSNTPTNAHIWSLTI
jgi:hypothetical protein